MRRRDFLTGVASIPALATTSSPASTAAPPAQGAPAAEQSPSTAPVGLVPPPRSQGQFPQVLVNQLGFRPDAGKFLVVAGASGAEDFRVVNMRQKGFQPSFVGKLTRTGTELGDYLVGDFSAFDRPGIYRVAVAGNYPFAGGPGSKLHVWSNDFVIGANVWDAALRKLVHYYRVQSCGPSKHGYNTPCHTGKIRRDDGGEAMPVLGGWHAADDCQRDAHEILHGTFGLLYLARARPDLDRELDLFGEICWGNDYFLALQSQDGYLSSGVEAADYFNWQQHDWWDSGSFVLRTAPAQVFLQHNFIAIQALIANRYRGDHPEYVSRCLEAAKRCFDYLAKRNRRKVEREPSYDLGTGVLAGVEMFRATGEKRYKTFARESADALSSLQAADGYWPEIQDARTRVILQPPLYSPLVIVGLSAAVRYLESDPKQARWREALEKFASGCASYFSPANAFGILPSRIYASRPPQPARPWKAQHYRYFIETNFATGSSSGPSYWQTGNVAMVAGYGVALLYAADILEQSWLRKLAQRQLDWVLGVNPFAASMIIGSGRNQPATYPSLEMVPQVPDIDGAVLEGPIGDEEDNPVAIPGFYAVVEFWMPHQAWVLWLMAELSAGRPARS
jgi:hypothetical protein